MEHVRNMKENIIDQNASLTQTSSAMTDISQNIQNITMEGIEEILAGIGNISTAIEEVLLSLKNVVEKINDEDSANTESVEKLTKTQQG